MHPLRGLAGLSMEQEQYLGVVDALVESVVSPVAFEIDATGQLPSGLAESLMSEGLEVLGLPDHIGGSGADRLTALLAIEAVAFGSASCAGRMVVSHAASAMTGPVGLGLAGGLTMIEAPVFGGGVLAGVGCSESGFRSDGPMAVLAGLNEGWTVGAGVTGIEIEAGPSRTGLRGAAPSQVSLKGVPAVVAPEEEVGGAMTWLLLGWATVAVGLAGRALEDAVQHLHTRHQFGQALAERPALREMVGDMERDLLGAAAGALVAADRGELAQQMAAASRAGQAAVSVANHAVQLHGGYGYIRETRVERLLRDALSVRARIAGLGAVPEAVGRARLQRGS